jgi:hypothetical protein
VVKENIAPFPQEEVARQGRHIEKQYGRYDADFWRGYNYQLPDPGFKEIFEDIQRRNEIKRKVHTEQRASTIKK